ncbi:hypothetical protein [Moorena producens]|uniref:hypothetical protein n=1 Tax=Moorena producens TaxID=1155739 RepID=UPI0013140685|nr:hypothetical protein [Moorena producens]
MPVACCLLPAPYSRLDAVAHGGNHGSCSWLEVTVRQARLVLMQSLMGETTAVAHGGNPQDRAASPRPRKSR